MNKKYLLVATIAGISILAAIVAIIGLRIKKNEVLVDNVTSSKICFDSSKAGGSGGLAASIVPCNDSKGYKSSDAVLAFDPSDLRSVAGFFDDVFVGKVLSNDDVRKEVDGSIFTDYTVVVIDSLKGNRVGTIKVTQQGGIYEGRWTFVQPTGVASKQAATDDLNHYQSLEIGAVYLFTTIRAEKQDINLLGPTPDSFVRLDVNTAGNVAETRDSVENLSRVQDMKDAIANQIPSIHSIK